MPSFRFEASDSAGRIEKGLLEADSPAAARATLRARGLVPLAVGTLAPPPGARRLPRRRFPESELANATRQLASLLSAGLPVAHALGATVEQAENRAFRLVCAAVGRHESDAHHLREPLAPSLRELLRV